MSAGSGVRHVERNDGDRPLRFVQTWLEPRRPGGEPEYELVRGIADGTPYAVERAGAVLYVRRLSEGERSAVPDAPRVYAHLVRGAVTIGGEALVAGDSARITGGEGLEVVADSAAELLLWDLQG
jgi:redox-sensitive bicupin YhaK (pirin superfamily)